MKNKNLKKIIEVALFMALIIVGSKIELRMGDFRFHLGNSMCLLAAFLFTPFYGGLAAGLGSMLFDILFYTSGLGCIVTFITKFVMGYVASAVFKKSKNVIISGILGEIAYIILYALKTFIERRIVLSMALEAVIPIVWVKVGASVLNAVVAVIISTILYGVISKIHKM